MHSQTENVGCGTGTSFINYQKEDGSVGVPQPWNELKLVDVPDMDYYAREGKGEICFRGDNVMQGKFFSPLSSVSSIIQLGYYNDPGKTAETIDEDGWLHTGDIGTWLENGTIKIIDRKKHIYKTAQVDYTHQF